MSKTSSITYVRESGGGGSVPHLFYNQIIQFVADAYHKTPETLDEQTRNDALILYYIMYWGIDIK